MRNKRLIVLLSVVAALVVIIVASGATFLVRDIEAYNYYGYTEVDPDYDRMVVEASGIKKNSSIFFLDETAIKDRIETAIANVGVVNIERKFPDRVSVNYVVYERMFQYESGGRYYDCYASGRIGSDSAESFGGVFTLKPKQAVSTTVGAYFQSASGYDRQIMTAFLGFMHDKGLVDRQIGSSIKFIDLTRDGYVYIRTLGGCSIELQCGIDEFARLMSRGWDIYADGALDTQKINRSAGLIRVWQFRGGDNPVMRSSYIPLGGEIGKTETGEVKYYADEAYYIENYALMR